MKKLHFLLILLFFISCKQNITEETVVGIQSYHGFPRAKTDTISKAIATYYGIKTIILPEKALPEAAFTNYKAPRYRADSLIRIQNRNKTDEIDFILGLTHQDICITKYDKDGLVKKPENKYTDFGIMGLAFCPGESCIVSSFRLEHSNSKIHFSRLKKVAVHEFGHNLGLPHCPDKSCVMTDAVENIATIDNANFDLCEKCKKKI
jgi:archaemetzincin